MDGSRWVAAKPRFFLPVRVLSKLFRRLMLEKLVAAHAAGRLQFFGRRQVSVLFLAVYLFPSILLAVPLFVFFTRIGLRGSLVGLLIVYVSQIVAVSIYMLRNYFDTVPVSLEEVFLAITGRALRE